MMTDSNDQLGSSSNQPGRNAIHQPTPQWQIPPTVMAGWYFLSALEQKRFKGFETSTCVIKLVVHLLFALSVCVPMPV